MRSRSRSFALLIGALLIARCNCSDTPANGLNPRADGGPVVCLDDVQAIVLEPASTTLTLDGTTSKTVQLSAKAVLDDGSQVAIDPAALDWSAKRADDTPPGTVTNGVFTSYPGSGGVVTITASDGCRSGEASVTLFVDLVVGQPSVPTPWPQTPVTTGAVPELVYPSDETRFPRNIYRTLFQWRTGPGTEFRLNFDGPSSKITVYTQGAHLLCAEATPKAGCWEADEKAWSLIAGSNAGEVVTWTVDALDGTTNPPTLRRSAPVKIGFSRRDVPGAIFYWSTTAAGIRRANVRAAEPENYLTGKPRTTFADGDRVGCVACHVVSRDGRYLVTPLKADSGDGLWVLEVTLDSPPRPLVKSVPETGGHGFATISPDDRRVIAAWKGKMWMLDRETGSKIVDLDLGTLEGTHPDWSPANSQLVFATGSGDAPGEASLALAPYDAATDRFGAPQMLLAGGRDASHLFPMFSPDGAWIAFSTGKGGHGDNKAQLQLIRGVLNPAPSPIELLRANRVVSNRMTDGQHQNSQPTWAPPGDLAWVAFNSKREYGVVREEGTQQIWVAGIDLSKAERGEDPSFPAFRLQFQGLDENNHRAFWTLDVRDPPDAGPAPDGGPTSDGGIVIDPTCDGGACVATGAECDPVGAQCCESSAFCDTDDNGATYTCRPVL